MTLNEVSELIDLLMDEYPNAYAKMTDMGLKKKIALWYDIFRNYDTKLVMDAVKKYIATNNTGFPPVPGNITELYYDFMDPEEITDEEAWEKMLEVIGDGLYNAENGFNSLPDAMQKALGSPNLIKNHYAMCTPKEMQYAKRDIMEAYKKAKAQEKSQRINNMLAIEADRVANIDREELEVLEHDESNVERLPFEPEK